MLFLVPRDTSSYSTVYIYHFSLKGMINPFWDHRDKALHSTDKQKHSLTAFAPQKRKHAGQF